VFASTSSRNQTKIKFCDTKNNFIRQSIKTQNKSLLFVESGFSICNTETLKNKLGTVMVAKVPVFAEITRKI
jgi:hypothetical protein